MKIDLAKHWATITDNLHDGLMVVDPRGVIVAVNPAAEAITGYEKDELQGQSCRVLNCTGCKIKPLGEDGPFCGMFRAGKVASKRCTITNRQGELVEVLKRAAVLKDEDGQVLGAVETLTDLTELKGKEKEIHRLRRSLKGRDGFEGMIGNTEVMQRMFRMIESVAGSETPVLIHGPSGSGKELVAGAIHRLGSRSGGPYIKVNCAALNQNLLESELFGHVKGSFTGADRDRMGRFQAADGGDLLLDEIGDLPLATQVKLLRVLEEKEIERVGDHRPVKVDVRILAATNRDLHQMISQGLFREDLFYRIEGVPIEVPSLAQRREDIPLLAQEFLQAAALKNGKEIEGLTPQAMQKLVDHSWPGNVRELKYAMEYAAVLCSGGLAGVDSLPPKITEQGDPVARPPRQIVAPNDSMCRELLEALRHTGGNQTQAAKLLRVSRVTVWNRLNRCGLDIKRDL